VAKDFFVNDHEHRVSVTAPVELGEQIKIVRALITFSNNTPSGDHNVAQFENSAARRH